MARRRRFDARVYTERGLPALDGGSGTRAAAAVSVPELSTVEAGNGTLSGRTTLDVPGVCIPAGPDGPGVAAYIMVGGRWRRRGGVVSESKDDFDVIEDRDDFEDKLLLSSEAVRRVYRPLCAVAGMAMGSGEVERVDRLNCGGAPWLEPACSGVEWEAGPGPRGINPGGGR